MARLLQRPIVLLLSLILSAFVGTGLVRADGIDDFNQGWIGQTLRAQRQLDLDIALADANWIGSHNSFNSGAYTTALSYLDPNQVDSIFNQLRIGARHIELDVHWTPKFEGAFDYPNRLLLCHGTADHIGCSTSDRYLGEGLDEILAWLGLASSLGEVLILQIEDHMEGRHGEAYSQINDRLGAWIYRSGGCQDIPSSLTKADVLNAGKRILVWGSGGCTGDGNWNGTVYTGLGAISRVWEDSTVIGGIGGGAQTAISASDVMDYFANGMNVIALDQLNQNDPRLEAAIWSWAVSEPNDFGGAEDCAAQVSNGRWIDDQCLLQNHFACRHAGHGGWAVSPDAGRWIEGVAACGALGADYIFSVPASSQENQFLSQARAQAGQDRVWINHNDREVEGQWQSGSTTATVIRAGELTLLGGESVAGLSRLFELGADCNLSLYSFEEGIVGGSLWQTNTQNAGINCFLDFQADGNLVLYEGGGQALWASGTSGTPDAQLKIQSDGNLALYNGAGLALWYTATDYPERYDIMAGQLSLAPPQILHTHNRKLELLADCNLVLYSFENGRTGGVLWQTDTAGAGLGCHADFQADGNFVLYDETGSYHWASGTSGTSGGRLKLQADGNLVVYNGSNEPLWSAQSNIPPEFNWSAGQFELESEEWAQNARRKLVLQSDCNLVLYNVDNAVVAGPLWQTDTSGAGVDCRLDFQADGNLVLYDGSGSALWASGTSGTSGAVLSLQEDGNLVVYNGVQQYLWATQTPGDFPISWSCGDLACHGDETCGTCPGDCGICEEEPPALPGLGSFGALVLMLALMSAAMLSMNRRKKGLAAECN
ncbi:MAG: hypothetical protein P8M78_07100 [Myxococcota bacterium]|nr:hypothetical protein [Myxococcota bacterium]